MFGTFRVRRTVSSIYQRLFGAEQLDPSLLTGAVSPHLRGQFFVGADYDFPFEIGRTSRGYTFGRMSLDPFEQCVRLLVNGGTADSFSRQLTTHLEIESEKTCGQLLGIATEDLRLNLPIWNMVLPWDHESLERRGQKYRSRFFINRTAHGYPHKIGNETDLCVDLLSYSQSQALQTQKLMSSIKKNGLLPSRNIPQVVVLMRENEWRWMMSDEGNHRAHILSALGHSSMRATIRAIVKSDHLEKLSNIKSGDFTPEQAIEIFNKAFYAIGPLRGLI